MVGGRDRDPGRLSGVAYSLKRMAYPATVLRVLIASPSDVQEARDAVDRALRSWNDANSRSKGVVLMPWRWETSAVPVLGGHPQKLINLQGVDDSDIVIALFGGRLGAPTPDAVSGTAEEVERATSGGRPVHLYFSSAPLPIDVDIDQLAALREFKKSMQERGLLGEFSNTDQLVHLVWQAIEHDLGALDFETPTASLPGKAVDFSVQPGSEREQSGFNKSGKAQYNTRRWIDVTNQGTQDAEGVIIEAATEGVFLGSGDEPTVIHRGQTRRFSLTLAMTAGTNRKLRIKWQEDGTEQNQEFYI